jgi:hypothetical protein
MERRAIIMARVNNLDLLCCDGRKTVSLIKTKIRSQQRFPTNRFTHPTERNPALTLNLIAHARSGLPKLVKIPAHKKAKSTSEKFHLFRCGDNPDFFPRIFPKDCIMREIDN